MLIYAIAFVFYVVDLANRSGDREAAVGPASNAATRGGGAAQSSAGTTTLTKVAAPPAQRGTKPEGADARRSRSLRIGFSLTVLGAILHLAATVLRGIGAERLPFANMYEFALTATCAIVLVFLVVQFFVDIRFLGALITGLAVIFLGVTKINYYVSIVPLQPALDTYWLVIHILVAVLGVAFLTLSFGLSVLQLMQTKRVAQIAAGGNGSMRWLATIPGVARLEDLAYRMAIIGFMFWTFTLIAGSIWAERAWSRYWGWDTKEVWTFVIWVLYAGFIHARATRGWRGTRSAWLSIIAYSAVIFNYAIVNVFFDGLHAYSGL
ncbi:MAG: c-type cytochrome biogenesis protein CcsB [Leucobacter sp.]